MLGLVGCEPRTGASTIAANLAVCASEVGLGPVLLVEADVERPRIRKHWRLPSGPGLAELALGIASCSECIYDGPAPGLHVVPAAEGPSRCVVGWDAAVVDAFLAEVAADHNLVLFDLPAAERMNHSLLLARRLDQVLLVVRAERTRGPHAKRVAERLREDGVPLGGVVLNRQRRYVPRWLSRWI